VYLIPALIGVLVLLVVCVAWLSVYPDMRKMHDCGGQTKPETGNCDRSSKPGATSELSPEPRAGAPSAAAVLESSKNMNAKPESGAPADGGGR
jgi:hypothetical protein